MGFDYQSFLNDKIFEELNKIKAFSPEVIEQEAAARKKPGFPHDKLVFAAADHNARMINEYKGNPIGLSNRREYLSRLVRMLQNCRDLGENGKLQINHVTLKKMESVVLCCLWTLYADRVRSGNLSKNIEISVTDLRYEMEKYGIRDQIDKSSFASILTLFTKYQLLQVIGKLGEEDCRICLYPSMQFVLEPQEFGKFVENVNRRMQEKWSREDEWETELTKEEEDGDEESDDHE